MSKDNPQPSPEFARLLSGFTEDQLDEREHERLAELLREEPGAKEHYVDYMVLHSMLRAEYASPLDMPAVKEPPKAPALGALGTLGTSFEQGVNYLCQPRRLSVASWAAMGWAMTALVLFVVILSKNTRNDIVVRGPMPSQSPDTNIARFAADNQCRWSDSKNTPMLGSPLGVGQQFSLESGLSQIRFNNGVNLIVEGPADFEFLSAKRISLYNGKLTARVPEQAVGFRVETPTVTVVDLGTEFGVSIDESGSTEVNCFVGAVVLDGPSTDNRATGKNASQKSGKTATPRPQTKISPRKIVAGEAVRVETEGEVKNEMAAAAAKKYVRQMPPTSLLPTVNVDFEIMGKKLFSGKGACKRARGKYWNPIGLVNRRCGPLWTGERHIGTVTIKVSDGTKSVLPSQEPDYVVGHALVDDYVAVTEGNARFSLGGLQLGARYDLYLYGSSGASQGPQNKIDEGAAEGSLFTVAGITKATKGLRRRERPFIEGKDHVVFRGLRADEKGEINGTWTNNPEANSPFNTNPYGPFNGLQLVGPLLDE